MIRVFENMHNLFDKLSAPNFKWKDVVRQALK